MFRVTWFLTNKPDNLYHSVWYKEDLHTYIHLRLWIAKYSEKYPNRTFYVESD